MSIEVSGSPAALQTAIDHTGRGGRLVLGSWYGASSAPLSLGLAFHRSKLSFKCSQVSLVRVNGLRTRSALAHTAMTALGCVPVARVTLASRLGRTPHCHLTELKPTACAGIQQL